VGYISVTDIMGLALVNLTQLAPKAAVLITSIHQWRQWENKKKTMKQR